MDQDDDDEEADINFLDDIINGEKTAEKKSSGVTMLSTESKLIPTSSPKIGMERATTSSVVTAPERPSSASDEAEEYPEPTVALKDVPKGMRHMLVYKGMKQPVAIIIGKRGVDRGLLNSLKLHFRTHEVVKIRVAKLWKDCIADMAAELEKKSGGVIIERHGSRIILFRGYTHADIPRRTPPADTYSKSWYVS